MYVAVRGWLECDREQLTKIGEIIAAGDVDRVYSGGWTFPERQCAWTNVVFFGADMREQHLESVLDQLRSIARVPATDADNDLVRGLFIVSHETEGTAQWLVHGGSVEIADASAQYGCLDE
ncbi:hypothetical protein [Streptacidiphilus anmyonensis]|uniref:hypothetical protein n=1 Tax=Streptacidiphilus anmyonensis TaxID=405782 RepID=UPI001F30A61F|nr:hypothetical protein [Streptacidiphilus anmyonensis]